MIAVIENGGSVLINCPDHTIFATKVEQVPDDAELLECFPSTPLPAFDPDDLYANAIGILGKFFSGSPINGDTIQYNETGGVWEFVPFTSLGLTVGVTEGGTGLTTIPSGSLLYANSADTLIPVSVGTSLGVTSGIFGVVPDTTVQKVDVAYNGNFVSSRKRINFIQGSNVVLGVNEDTVGNKIDITVSASSSAGSRWDQVSDPIGNLSLNHGSSNTVFSWGSSTAGNSLFQLRDGNGNTGNGYILDVVSGTSSNINLVRFTASGGSNGVVVDNTGKLQATGSGSIEATTLKGLSGNGFLVKTGSTYTSRTLSSTSVNLVVTNGDGVSGSPTLALSNEVVVGISNDTNVTGSISAGILTLGWAGTLTKSRQHATTVYNDQANSYVAGNKQTFSPNATNAGLNIGSISSDPVSLSNGDIWLNSTVGKFRFREAGTTYDLLQLVKGRKTLSDEVATPIFEVDLSPLTACAMVLNYSIVASDGTNVQIRSGSLRFSAFNKSGTIQTEYYISSEGIAPSAGTLDVVWGFVAGSGKVTVTALGNTSLTANMFELNYSIDNLSDRAITKL